MSVELLRAYLRQQKGSKRRTFIYELFQNMDKDKSRQIDYNEFKNGLKRLGMDDLQENEYRKIFNAFDRDHSNRIDFDEFTSAIKGPMAACRAQVIDEAFKHLDVNGDGILTIDDFRIVFDAQAKEHPKFLDESWTLETVLSSFLDAFDTPGKCDGKVTLKEFHNYYGIVSATIDSDSHFVNMIKTSYGLD